MDIKTNVAWLEDLAMHSGINGNSQQEQVLWTVANWIVKADTLLGMQSALLDNLKIRCEELHKENEYLQNRLARFGA